jgi:hypothetical protein
MSHFDQLTKNKQNNNEKKAEKEKRKCEGGIYIFFASSPLDIVMS